MYSGIITRTLAVYAGQRQETEERRGSDSAILLQGLLLPKNWVIGKGKLSLRRFSEFFVLAEMRPRIISIIFKSMLVCLENTQNLCRVMDENGSFYTFTRISGSALEKEGDNTSPKRQRQIFP